ncbi:hypothetical protein FDP41_005784 [Naegleria fowleri]|uniref:Uncharacterized protein n=1 Tax=Naegleria fowleri TaxID=5763 RepID=A0A6A5BKZ0_NAEFO|nr:uncharacterized protein FDP41_005784 [Naegleria fowleri]KAF0975031.1 hypothetical protein FDP41_005784 [Naegleria fowleri]
MERKVSPEQIKDLRKIIDQQLRSKDVYNQIREILSDYLNMDHSKSEVHSEEHVLQSLKERGVVEEIIKSLHSHTNKSSVFNKDAQVSSLLGKRDLKKNKILHLRLVGGKAFMEYDDNVKTDEKMICFFNYKDQRFISQPVTCCCNPVFEEDFIIDLEIDSLKNAFVEQQEIDDEGIGALLQINNPIDIIVLTVDNEGRTKYIGGHRLEWRRVLKKGVILMTVELGGGSGIESKVSKGVLEIRLELLPRPSVFVTANEISQQLSIERNRDLQAEREFYMYCKQWFEEYCQIRESHKRRVVKLYAEIEDGSSVPVVSFISPLKADRLINSPSEAARFVSLFAYEHSDNNMGAASNREIWWSPHAFIAKKKGDVENHALLLCSLLLGFNMDAYVCVGTDDKGAKIWVMTRSKDNEITFWNSITGQRFEHHSDKHKLLTVGCVFNHNSYYANIQKTDNVSDCVFDLENETLWKSMSQMKLSLVRKLDPVTFIPPRVNSSQLERDTETALKKAIGDLRKDLGLNTSWDDNLGYVLSTALQAYEVSHISNTASNTLMDEFNEIIKNIIPPKHTFKAFPIQLNHTSVKRIINTCQRHKNFKNILESVGDRVRFGIRVKIFTYPEDVQAVWLMICNVYLNI